MKLSISNIAWSEQEDVQVYELMNKYGFTGLEIAPTRFFDNPYCAPAEMIEDRKSRIKQFGLEIVALQSLHYGKEGIALFESNAMREKLFEYTKKSILFAEKTGAEVLVFGSPKLRNYKNYESDYEIAVDFFKRLGDFAFEHNSCLCIEANPKEYNTNFINDNTQALALVKDVGAKGFMMHLDCGTIILNNENLDIINKSKGYLKHVHISSPFLAPINPQNRQLHSELYKKLLSVGYDRWVSIEMRKAERDNLSNIEACLEYVSGIFKGAKN